VIAAGPHAHSRLTMTSTLSTGSWAVPTLRPRPTPLHRRCSTKPDGATLAHLPIREQSLPPPTDDDGNVTALLLGYDDLETARSFFLDVLGFEDEWEVRDGAGQLSRSHVRLGDTVLMLDKPGAHGVKSPQSVGGVTHLVVISVGDVDAHHERAAAARANVRVGPCDRPWGRDYELEDSGGYVFSFTS